MPGDTLSVPIVFVVTLCYFNQVRMILIHLGVVIIRKHHLYKNVRMCRNTFLILHTTGVKNIANIQMVIFVKQHMSSKFSQIPSCP